MHVCWKIYLFSLVGLLSQNLITPQANQSFTKKINKQPNFVILFADDIGWGDLGVNWPPNKPVTPNLNKLAEEGIRFTDFHAASSVCSPSRAALLTGRIGLRTGVHSIFNPNSKYGLPLNETTLAEVLVANGYNTGIIGKWHLGITKNYNPVSRGFNYYYGLPYSNDMGCVDVPVYNLPKEKECPKAPMQGLLYNQNTNIYNNSVTSLPLFENYEIVEQPADLIQLGDYYGNKTVEFIKQQTQSPKPFFLYVAFTHMHMPLSHAPRFANSTDLKTVYADTLYEMDDIVGRIVKALKTYNFYNNTLIFFSGDNGPWEGKCQYSGNPGPFLGTWQRQNFGGSTGKATTWEGGHREPTFFVWPNHIAPNQVSDALTSNLDVFPTFLSITGIDLPKWRRYDGIDLTDLLLGKTDSAHDVLFHPNSGDTPPIGEIDTLRMGPFKVYWRTGGQWPACDHSLATVVDYNPPLIFDVVKDPSESVPLTPETLPNFDAIVAQAKFLLQNFLQDVGSDNTTITDYSTSESVVPCCDHTKFLCRCKKV